MNSIKEVLSITIKSLEDITDLFYKQRNNEAYNCLNSVLLNIETTINQIYKYNLENNSIYIDNNKIMINLNEIMNAMQVKDTILIADILHYEIKDQFEKVLIQL